MSDAPWMSEDQMRKRGAEFYGKPVADLTREELFFIVYHQAHKSAAADLEFDKMAGLIAMRQKR